MSPETHAMLRHALNAYQHELGRQVETLRKRGGKVSRVRKNETLARAQTEFDRIAHARAELMAINVENQHETQPTS